ncbi:MAG: Gfo/Idh/MocA family oxidoreductase [Deltaproteobacteria bacterium]|nr:Gfo/Idh/MocA family oxidoreductase [Deltaproteobacteria bacterium]
MNVLLIGPGKIGIEYFHVLQGLEVPKISVVGRSRESSEVFFEKTGCRPHLDDLDIVFANNRGDFDAAIVAVNVEELFSCTKKLIANGVRRILVEKPAAVTAFEIDELSKMAEERSVSIWVGYNRRFYSSVRELRRRIVEEGGLLSFHFDFTEWIHTVVPTISHKGVLDNWLFANSSHVIDLAFHLGGEPRTLQSMVAGSLEWHPTASRFVGSGRSHEGSLFSYHANWESPGRWGLELCTRQSRYILRPLEKLHRQRHKSITIEEVQLDDTLDRSFKPGLFLQVKTFLSESPNTSNLISLAEHNKRVKSIYLPMLGRSFGDRDAL